MPPLFLAKTAVWRTGGGRTAPNFLPKFPKQGKPEGAKRQNSGAPLFRRRLKFCGRRADLENVL